MMNELTIYLLIALIFAPIGFYIGKLLTKLSTEKEKASLEERASLISQAKEIVDSNIIQLQKELQLVRQEKEDLSRLNTRQDAELINLHQKLTEHKNEIEKLQDKFTKEFENLANKILEEKSSKFTKQNRENIQTILNPLKEKIASLKKSF